jgi:hypothetical protein
LSWRAIEAVNTGDGPRLAAFVHVPLLARDSASQRKNRQHRVTLEQLVDAGEAMLLEMVRLTRQAIIKREAAFSSRDGRSFSLPPRSGGEGSRVGGVAANTAVSEFADRPPTPDPSPPRADARGGRGES